MNHSSKRFASAVRVSAIAVALLLLGVLLTPAAEAAHVNSTANLAATQTGDPDGTGTIDLTLDVDTGEVCYNLSVSNIDAPTAAHIHAGAAGSAGGVVVNFGTIALDTDTCVMSTPVQVQAIVADPMDFYVNVHNAAFPAGAIRAQVGSLTPAVLTSTTALDPTGDPAGSGSIDLSFDTTTGEVCYTLTTTGLASAITAAHIHIGAAGVNGGVLISLDYVAAQSYPKCVMSTVSDVNTVLGDPAGHYVNVHTVNASGGAIRGQVATPTASIYAATFTLDGLGFGDPDGSGTAVFTFYPDGGVCFTLSVSNIDAPNAAHIHSGIDGVQGAVLVDLDLPNNMGGGCVQSTPLAVADILAAPSEYYMNVHNVAFPDGAIRGQLSATSPAPATTAVDVGLMATGEPGGTGAAQFNIDPATGRLCYTLTVSNIGTVTAAHIHTGAAGVNGGVLVGLDLTGGLTGCVFTSVANAMTIVGDLAGHYVNVHTDVAGGGAIRAQLDAPAPVPGGYIALNPERILDTRDSIQGDFDTPWGAGETRAVKVTDIGGVPATDVDAVVLNVTTVNPTADFSWLTVSPTGSPPATTAVHTFGTASYTTEILNDVVIAKVGAGGTIDIRNEAGNVDLVIDVVGFYSSIHGTAYNGLNPERILDTRNSTQGDFDTPWAVGETRAVKVTDIGGVPTDADAVVLNVTSVNPSAEFSWLTVSPTGSTPATTAVHTFGTADFTTEILNDVVIAKVGTGGTIDIRNEAGNVDLVIDVVGYYSKAMGSPYKSLNPDRILDTRNSTQGDYSTPWPEGTARTVNTGFGTCATAVALHVTTVEPSADFSWLTVSPTGSAPTITAVHTFGNADFTTQILDDIVIAKTGTGGSIDILNQSGTTDLVIDIVGFYGDCE